MTQREKVLAAAVGGMLFFMGAIWGYSKISEAFQARELTIEQLEKDKRQQERTILFGKEADREILALKAKSLPADRHVASAQYQAWLIERAVDTGFSGVNVIPARGYFEGDLYFRHVFDLTGRGSLEQITSFLYKFYSVDFLHRLENMQIKPSSNSGVLDFGCRVEAVSILDSDVTTLTETPSKRLKQEELSAYIDSVVARNLFAPANKPPQLAIPSSPQGYPERTVEFTVTATDPEQQELSFSLEGEAPEGAEIDRKSGRFRWTPANTGEYEVAIRVSDSGFPSLEDVKSIKIRVSDPPPVPVRQAFDAAMLTEITGITRTGEKYEVWLTSRTEGRVYRLTEGDAIEIGTIVGKVGEITEREVKFVLNDGRTVVVPLGKNLVSPDTRLSGI